LSNQFPPHLAPKSKNFSDRFAPAKPIGSQGEVCLFLKGAAMLMRATTILSLMLALTISSSGQTRPANLKPGSVEAKALAFFEQIKDRSFDDYLKHVRLPKVSEAHKADVLTRIAKGEEVTVSGRMKDKLASLDPILKYHERNSVVEIRVIGVKELFVGFQGRAVLLISEPALNLLPAPELQAVVAHELGHEYFWSELMEARRQKKRKVIREIELRCDGIAMIALSRLGLDPAKLVSAIGRMRTFNARSVSTDPLYHPTNDERARFISAMSELAQQRGADLASLDRRESQ
jgi:Zn-dependent protease with chaperone function